MYSEFLSGLLVNYGTSKLKNIHVLITQITVYVHTNLIFADNRNPGFSLVYF